MENELEANRFLGWKILDGWENRLEYSMSISYSIYQSIETGFHCSDCQCSWDVTRQMKEEQGQEQDEEGGKGEK